MRIVIGVQQQLLLPLMLIVSVALVGLATADEALLRSLCTKDATAEVNSIAQVQSLIATLESGAAATKDCKQEVKQSILNLKPIIEMENVCSLESYDRMAKYFALHVQEKTIAIQQDKEVRRVPPAIKNFFIAYGLQVSSLCRESLMENLAAATNAHIPADDLDFVTEWIDDSNKNYRTMIGKRAKLEELLLLGDIEKLIGKHKVSKKRRKKNASSKVRAVSVSAENKAKVDDLKARCAHRFKPIYDQLIVPIVQLSYLGFNYKDPKMADKFSQFEQSAQYKNWFKIVFICDSILNMKVVSVKNDKVGTRFLTDNNVDQLERERKLDLGEPALPKPIDFEQIVRIGAEMSVLDRSNGQLLKSVANYHPKASVSGKLLKRAAKNLPKMLKSYIRTGKVHLGLDDLSGDRLRKPSMASSKFGESLEESRETMRRISRTFMVVAGLSLLGVIAIPILFHFHYMALAVAMVTTGIAAFIAIASVFTGILTRMASD